MTAPPPAPAPAETAARHLVQRVPTARATDHAATARERLRDGPYDALDAVYVVDDDHRLKGLVRLSELLRLPGEQRLGTAMRSDLPRITPDTDQEEVASIALRTGLAAVPVVDEHERLLGVVPPERLLAILRREHIEDLHRFAGIANGANHTRDALEAPPLKRVRARLPWLLVGLAGSMVATLVMAAFEQALTTRIAIAFFVPGIVYLADAIGTQTEAVAVRGLSLNHFSSIGALLAGELATGTLIGLALAALALPLVWVAFGSLALAAAVAGAIVAAGAAACGVGLLLPWLLSRLGHDPAHGSGPLATVIQDVLTLLVYFGFVLLFVL
jgi:magnesium transporter